jgi:hypothetical protein
MRIFMAVSLPQIKKKLMKIRANGSKLYLRYDVCWEDYVMMTTSVGAMVNMGLDPRQMGQPMQLKANEKTAVEQLEAEEQLQAGKTSSPEISIVKSPADLRMYQINQAADAGMLRPVWLEILEMADMDPDMPRMRDLISRAAESKDGDSRQAAEEAERVVKSEQAADGAEQSAKSEKAADGAERAIKFELSSSDKAERTVKSERASTEGAERAVKSENAADGARRTVNSSE